nr:antigen WC1.1-like [Danio rerio]|eukprot:XP_021327209.1 antigen WC1.1-like [Danio rerio]
MRAASVLCKQLNCGIAVSVVGSDWFGEGSGEIWADVFDCDGNETKLSECSISSWSRAERSHRRDVGVICSNSSLALHEGLVRLSGESQCEGQVEVLIQQVWRKVLLDSWSLTESSVVCRQLGCGSVLNFSGSSSSSPEHSHECVMGFQCSGSEAHLGNCSSPQTLNCSSTQQLSITCLGRGSIRLVGSGGDCAGRLEVFHSGSWGTVCDDSWDIKDAHVVCRQLQCGVALSNQQVPAWFGPGSGPIWLDEVECEGNETSLWSCSSPGWGKHDCRHKEDVGVICSAHVPLRLRGGDGRCSGRLEVYHNTVWGSVCDDLWDISDAQVVCRQLGCGAALRADGNSAFGAGEGVVWLNRVQCRGNELHLWNCPLSLNNHTDCSYKEHAGLTCADLPDISVSTTPATSTSSSAAVSQTVSSTSVSPPQTGPETLPVPPVLLIVLGVVLLLLLVPLLILIQQNRVMRRGRRDPETVILCLLQCVISHVLCKDVLSEQQHSGYEDADDLLSAGPHSYDDISIDGPGDDLPENYDDVIVVRQLSNDKAESDEDYSDLDVREYASDMFGYDDVGEEPEKQEANVPDFDAVSKLKCLPQSLFSCQIISREVVEEMKMKSCLTVLLMSTVVTLPNEGKSIQFQKCIQKMSFPFLCTGEVRLVGGNSPCAGRVEVYHKGQWGTVCDDGWDLNDAKVVCKELGCDKALRAAGLARFGWGSGPIWMGAVNCTGSESRLKDCKSRRRGVSNCKHDEDAGVVCLGKLAGRLPRLINGPHLCAGRLEIQNIKTWMSVCDVGFDQQDAEVVCRELDCGVPVQVLRAAAFGKVESQMWTHEIHCRGNESHLVFCPAFKSSHCTLENAVGVICSG